MRFTKGDKVLVIGNGTGMSIQGVEWPLKGTIYNIARCNVPSPSAAIAAQEYYQVMFDRVDSKTQKILERDGYQAPGRWVIPGNLLKRDKFCPICCQEVGTYGEGRELIAEHSVSTERCYGSHMPLELSTVSPPPNPYDY